LFALNAIPDSAIVYEGSITAPEFGKKVNLAVQNGVEPRIIILNPTLDLSLKNIKSREMEIGRGVKKEEVVAKYADLYENMHLLFKQLRDENPELRKNKYPIEFQIYNKETNIPTDLSVSYDLEDLYHGTREDISKEYDKLIKNYTINDEER